MRYNRSARRDCRAQNQPRRALPPPHPRTDVTSDFEAEAERQKKEKVRRAREQTSQRARDRGRAGLRASRSLGRAVASDVRATADIIEAITVSLLPVRLVHAIDYAADRVSDVEGSSDTAQFQTLAESKKDMVDDHGTDYSGSQ